MRFAAERHGVRCVGVTISAEQAALGRERCAGLPVEFRLADYRGLDERFDRIVSLGMFEHVGHRNHGAYLQVAARCLKPGGLFLLHTIGRNEAGLGTDPWIDKYVFPNGELPTLAQIGAACEQRFVVEDVHNFGADYDRTLMAWHANFESAWQRFQHLGERFRRMWRYYLLLCAGAFRARDIQLWQWVLSPPGHGGVYPRIGA
jgi:cyclopropane-fatty-acyl-phospholipid synthase